jgi:hypothetical protein
MRTETLGHLKVSKTPPGIEPGKARPLQKNTPPLLFETLLRSTLYVYKVTT